MRRITTTALALSLCAFAHANAAARRSSFTNARAAAPLGFDGQAVTTRAKRRARKSPRRRADAPRIFADPIPALPASAVTEIDLEGLKKLLARGDDPSKARPLLVNFWATWCDPCRAEFPDLVKINNDYKDRGLDMALVSGDDISEIKAGVPKFLREMRAGMPAYLLNVPDMGLAINTVDRTWGGDLPATFIYDRDGKMVFKHFGRIDPKEVRAALDTALGGK
jgi:thiol-disulfide isomerase/thioredoxin